MGSDSPHDRFEEIGRTTTCLQRLLQPDLRPRLLAHLASPAYVAAHPGKFSVSGGSIFFPLGNDQLQAIALPGMEDGGDMEQYAQRLAGEMDAAGIEPEELEDILGALRIAPEQL